MNFDSIDLSIRSKTEGNLGNVFASVSSSEIQGRLVGPHEVKKSVRTKCKRRVANSCKLFVRTDFAARFTSCRPD